MIYDETKEVLLFTLKVEIFAHSRTKRPFRENEYHF